MIIIVEFGNLNLEVNPDILLPKRVIRNRYPPLSLLGL